MHKKFSRTLSTCRECPVSSSLFCEGNLFQAGINRAIVRHSIRSYADGNPPDWYNTTRERAQSSNALASMSGNVNVLLILGVHFGGP